MPIHSKKLSSAAKGINVVLDTTWGDGGKGKVVDLLAQNADVVIRYAGGPNAGHTIVNEKGEFKLHVVPSGILNPKTFCIVASGVVVNPLSVVDEITDLQKRGITISSKNLLISQNAHLIMPWHRKRDGLEESVRSGEKIGTTGQGIGPAYSDRRLRVGLRTKDLLLSQNEFDKLLLREVLWQDRLTRLMSGEALLSDLDNADFSKLSSKELLQKIKDVKKNAPYNIEEIRSDINKAKKVLNPLIGDTMEYIMKAKETKKNILGEGAQGALLDIDLGGYPFVTSSNPGLTGFASTTGIQGWEMNNIYGVTKAYATRVGGGPMPTELLNKTGKYIREKGHEYGATTGRPRRCGWFDAVAVRYGSYISGANCLAITKLDILDDLEEVQICIGYKVGTKEVLRLTDPAVLAKAKPVYERLPGWETSTSGITEYDDLPARARKYLSRIEKLTGLPIKIVSVSPERDATIFK